VTFPTAYDRVNAEKAKARRAESKEQGRCQKCHRRPARTPEASMCQSCTDANAGYRAYDGAAPTRKAKKKPRPRIDSDGDVILRVSKVHLASTLDGARPQLAAHKAQRPDPLSPAFQAWADDKDIILTHLEVLEGQARNKPKTVILPPEVVAAKLAPKPIDPFADLREPNLPTCVGVSIMQPTRSTPTPIPHPIHEASMATPRKTPTERLATKVAAYLRGLDRATANPTDRTLRNEANSLKGHVLALCSEYKLTVPDLPPLRPLADPKRGLRPVEAVPVEVECDACTEDPDGLHFTGCGCENSDVDVDPSDEDRAAFEWAKTSTDDDGGSPLPRPEGLIDVNPNVGAAVMAGPLPDEDDAMSEALSGGMLPLVNVDGVPVGELTYGLSDEDLAGYLEDLLRHRDVDMAKGEAIEAYAVDDAMRELHGQLNVLEIENTRLGEELDRARQGIHTIVAEKDTFYQHLMEIGAMFKSGDYPDFEPEQIAPLVLTLCQDHEASVAARDTALVDIERLTNQVGSQEIANADLVLQVQSLSQSLQVMTNMRNDLRVELQRAQAAPAKASTYTPGDLMTRIRQDLYRLLVHLEDMPQKDRLALERRLTFLSELAGQACDLLEEQELGMVG